jgi:heme/copper-type cytochrome/quinol oxidase subunit 3
VDFGVCLSGDRQLADSLVAAVMAATGGRSALADTADTGDNWFVGQRVVGSAGGTAIKRDAQTVFLSHWRIALVLGAAFVLIILYEWISLPYSGIYSDVFRMMTAFHGVHALAIVMFMGMIDRGARAGKYGPANFWPVEGAAGLWYFVVAAWLLFYVVLYWI